MAIGMNGKAYVSEDPWIENTRFNDTYIRESAYMKYDNSFWVEGVRTGRFNFKPAEEKLGGKMGSKFSEGDLVTVTIKNVKVIEAGYYGNYIYGKNYNLERSSRRSAGADEFYISTGTDVVIVPGCSGSGSFTPVAGEIYEAEGMMFFARQDGDFDYIALTDITGLVRYSDDPSLVKAGSLADFAKKNPVKKSDSRGRRV